MPQAAFLLLMNSIFLMLRIAPSDSFPRPLSKEEEEENLKKWLDGDIEARNTLIEHNLRLVAHIVKKYYTQSDEQDDLISIGTIGLIKGISSYRPEKGTRLATYAARCVENEILMYYRAKKKSAGEIFFDEPLEYDKDGNALTLMDFIHDEEDLVEQVEQSMQEKQLYEYLKTKLTKRELTVIAARYGLYGRIPQTQREVANALGISRSYVSRIEKRALKLLREAYETVDRTV